MAYLSAEDVKHIRVALKKEFPQYKFSVTRDHHLGVNINFMKGPAFNDYEYFNSKIIFPNYHGIIPANRSIEGVNT